MVLDREAGSENHSGASADRPTLADVEDNDERKPAAATRPDRRAATPAPPMTTSPPTQRRPQYSLRTPRKGMCRIVVKLAPDTRDERSEGKRSEGKMSLSRG